MAELTDMEMQAIQDTRSELWDAMVTLFGEEQAGKIFGDLSEQSVDFLIHKIWNGCKVSMRKQSFHGEVPVPVPGTSDDPNDMIPF